MCEEYDYKAGKSYHKLTMGSAGGAIIVIIWELLVSFAETFVDFQIIQLVFCNSVTLYGVIILLCYYGVTMLLCYYADFIFSDH